MLHHCGDLVRLEAPAMEFVVGLPAEQLQPLDEVAAGAHWGLGVKLGQQRRRTESKGSPGSLSKPW